MLMDEKSKPPRWDGKPGNRLPRETLPDQVVVPENVPEPHRDDDWGADLVPKTK
jgi:hypothetical protein